MDPHSRQAADHFGTLQPYVIRECSGADCGVRFPVAEAATAYVVCHLCAAPTSVVATVVRHDGTTLDAPTRTVIGVADNVRSALNVGTLLRTAEGAGIERFYLGGISPAGDNPKVTKTSLGAEDVVAWSHHPNLVPVIQELIDAGVTLWAMESTPRSTPLGEIRLADVGSAPIAVVVGNEIAGVDPGILELCHRHVHLPMRGTKNSLNVAVAFGIAAYHLLP